MFEIGLDTLVRQRAFEHLDRLNMEFGEVIPRSVLLRGFELNGERIHLISQRGIFTPSTLALPLTVTTAPNGPYNDEFSDDGILQYRYQGNDPNFRDNVGLRELMNRGIPLIYFHGTVPGSYVAERPVFIVADSPETLTFGITFDERSHVEFHIPRPNADITYRRKYTTAQVRRRLHQQSFRSRVLRAYTNKCALCNLKHTNLLEAAHIIPDNEERGEPVVSNGLSLCKIHHAAFDHNILGIRPDYVVEIREDILEEIDGPMLQHGLKEMHRRPIFVPQRTQEKPNVVSLEERYEQFRAA